MRIAAGGDLDEIIGRGHLRVLVTPSRTEFEVRNGLQRGDIFNAVKAFESFVNKRLAPRSIKVAMVPSTSDALVKELLARRGDIAANVLQTFERDDQVAFATPIRTGVREWIVTGPASAPLVTLEDIAGRSIHVRRNSDHHASLVRLNDQLKKAGKPGCTIVLADHDPTEEDLLEQVNAGAISATLVNEHIFHRWRPLLPMIAANPEIAVSQDGVIAWVTPKDTPKLLELVNQFFAGLKPAS